MSTEADKMAEHEGRIRYIEMQFVKVSESMEKLADSVQQIAMATAEHAKMEETIGRAFKAIESLAQDQKSLSIRLDDYERDQLKGRLREATKALSDQQIARRSLVIKIIGGLLAAAVTIILAHFGIKVL